MYFGWIRGNIELLPDWTFLKIVCILLEAKVFINYQELFDVT